MFKKGDRVKITSTRGCGCGCKVGDMFEVTEVTPENVSAMSENGKLHQGQFNPEDLELVDHKVGNRPAKAPEPGISVAVKSWLSSLPKK